MKSEESRRRDRVIGVPIDLVDWDDAIFRISGWGRAHDSRVVCICNVHSVVTARSDGEFFDVIAGADLATPDGAPVAWMLRWLTGRYQPRINGPDLMWKYCDFAQVGGESIFLYGGSQETLEALRVRLAQAFPALRIVGHYSPPFRELTQVEDHSVVRQINESGANVLWVSLGCPKQEKWMAAHRGRINAVMIGVGAAFDYHAGAVKRAPIWMQRNGLEWIYRLISEPRRLWRRYLVTNSLFIIHAIGQVLVRQGVAREAKKL